jgi:hypothetical protein
MSGPALVLYARVPRAGAVKTRMRPRLGPEECLELHRALLHDSLALLRRAADRCGARPILAFSEPWEPGDQRDEVDLALAAAGLARQPQCAGDLGERLRDTFERLGSLGLEPCAVIGSDSPTLPAEHVRRGFELLERGDDLVLGPAEDGGFYLVGAGRALPPVFAGVSWGTSLVLEQTLRAAARCGCRASLLPPWHDVDRPEDLERLRSDLEPGSESPAGRTALFLDRLARAGRRRSS